MKAVGRHTQPAERTLKPLGGGSMRVIGLHSTGDAPSRGDGIACLARPQAVQAKCAGLQGLMMLSALAVGVR